ncbi:ADP-ribosylglycohydrolase family protein [Risungbinella massiliensis]|uniref:ADP-ribosylglycohydrolase family protein n=1 Tax=Risungbinella massiliensis TaxID=1329796 RepID=UPI0005CC8758|nr:ADP-ribosylglycohydrolase family protein [Risungbinella massiliensis]
METRKRKAGSLLGLAWGDVLGCPVEGWRDNEIREVYGEYSNLPTKYELSKISIKRKRKLRPLGLHSDDTQQAMALLNVLSGGWSPKAWADLLLQGQQIGTWRGIGRNFVASLHRLRKGGSYHSSGSSSAGIGAAMRIGPIGAWFAGKPDEFLQVAIESTLVTHSDQRAAVFAAMVAYTVSCMIEQKSIHQILSDLSAFTEEAELYSKKLVAKGWKVENAESQLLSKTMQGSRDLPFVPLDKMREEISLLARPHLQAGFTRAHPNQGFVLLGGLHALLVSLRSDKEPEELLLDIIRQGFDTDTVAAIAGSILGARYGMDWIPTHRLLDQENIVKYAQALSEPDIYQLEEGLDFLSREKDWSEMEQSYQRKI